MQDDKGENAYLQSVRPFLRMRGEFDSRGRKQFHGMVHRHGTLFILRSNFRLTRSRRLTDLSLKMSFILPTASSHFVFNSPLATDLNSERLRLATTDRRRNGHIIADKF